MIDEQLLMETVRILCRMRRAAFAQRDIMNEEIKEACDDILDFGAPGEDGEA